LEIYVSEDSFNAGVTPEICTFVTRAWSLSRYFEDRHDAKNNAKSVILANPIKRGYLIINKNVVKSANQSNNVSTK
jgi:hypothetical protein